MAKKKCSIPCREWIAERTDDSLKTMFQADEAYQNGNKTKAIAYLESQVKERLPIIHEKAVMECGRISDSVTKMLQADLNDIADDIRNDKTADTVHSHVMKIDKKFALKGYRAFCSCGGR